MFYVLKKIFVVFFIILVLLVSGIAFFIYTFDLNRYKSLAEEKLTAALNRPVSIESMSTKLSLIPTINITGFKVMNNAPFQEEEPLLLIQKMEAELELAPLLNRHINIHKINIHTAQMNLFKDKEATNWTFEKQQRTDSVQAKPTFTQSAGASELNAKNFHLNLVSIDKLNISYREEKKNEKISFENLEMKQFHILNGKITYNGKTFTVDLNTNNFFDFINNAPNITVNLKVQSSILNVTLKGTVGDLKKMTQIKGNLNIYSSNLKNTATFFQVRHPLLPTRNATLQFQFSGDLTKMVLNPLSFDINGEKDLKATGKGELRNLTTKPELDLSLQADLRDGNLTKQWNVLPMMVQGDIQLSPTSFKTTDFKIDANRSDVLLSVNATKTGKKYAVQANLKSDFLDIYDFIKKERSVPNTAPKQTVRSTQNKNQNLIPWDLFKDMNVDFNASINHFKTTDELSGYVGIMLNASLKNGNLNAPFELTLLNGKLSGDLKAVADHKMFMLSAEGRRLNLNDIKALQPFAKDILLYSKASLTTTGSSPDDLLKTLNGQVILQSNQGQIVHKTFVELPQLLNLNNKNQNSIYGHTDDRVMIKCAAANINIKNGILTGENQVALETNILNLIAGGTVNLPQRTLDISVRPALLNSSTVDNLLSLTQAIRIAGPFNQLKPSVDTKQAAQNLVQAGLNKLTNNTETSSFCALVLGDQSLIAAPQSKKTPTVAADVTVETPAPRKESKQQFKEQLLNSLFQVLTPQ